MKKLVMAAGLVAAIIALVGGGLAFRALAGGGSDSALAASKSTEDVFTSLGANQNGTDTTNQPWLGAQIKRTSDGLTVSAVIADSPAEKAGLKRGDVITAVDGTQVSDMQALLNAIKGKKVGDSITLSITRDGNAQDVTATLEARPAPLAGANPVLPELSGIPRDQLFSHIQGGSFQFTDSAGKSHTATIDLGTVSSADANAKTVTVDLNSGGSKTYTIGDGVVTVPADLSKFTSGDKVVVLSVDGALRAIAEGAGGMMPFMGKLGRGMHGGRQGFGMSGDDENGGTGNNGNSGAQGLRMPSRGGASNIEYR
ncbi:MAG: PDZ domain-containing protein [Dehalococcoidia bacterium]|nr:PDZ domain-containing protein [Dehalococcoidia bacterium]